ncbi:MAG TPA: hypothetical protein VEA37_04635 [Flavobacterium sp.]|nr:hypothetical protein [Flavobacterium sp.]
MKILITILGLLNGLYMTIDGVYVMLKGKYIGPARPGPWSAIFANLGLDVFRLGPLFVIFGILWLVWLWALWSHHGWAHTFGILISILTLWYLPVGTLFSIVILLILLMAKEAVSR